MPGKEEIVYNSDAAYLITGGLGGIGLWIARGMVECNARHLVLIGRRGLTPAARGPVDELRRKGANIVIAKADVSRREDIESVLTQISSSMPPLRGIVHAAGTVQDGVLLNLSWQNFVGVMAPKISGAWNLHTLTRGMQLDFFVMCSSTASIMGSPGQCNYAAANAFLDGLAYYRRALELPALTINWGAWDNVGMTLELGAQEAIRRAEMGIRDIEPQQGTEFFSRLVNGSLAQAAVLPIQWPTFFRQFRQGAVPPIFAALFDETNSRGQTDRAADDGGSSSLLEDIRHAPPNEKIDLLFNHIKHRVIHVLRLDMSQPVDFQKGLTEIGMDSLMAVELRNLLQVDFKGPIPTSVMFECSTILELSNYILDEFFAEQPMEQPSYASRKQVEQPVPGTAIMEMSEDEAEQFLIEELNRRGF